MSQLPALILCGRFHKCHFKKNQYDELLERGVYEEECKNQGKNCYFTKISNIELKARGEPI